MEFFFSIYSLIYIPIIFSVFVSDLEKQKKVIIFWIVILTLFRGLRWECGTDWSWYEKSFNEIDYTNFWCYITTNTDEGTKTLEAGWGLLLLICKWLFGTYTSFLLVSNLIRFIFLYKIAFFFTKKPIIFFVSCVVTENFFPVRQDLANILFFYGFCWLVTNRKKFYFMYNGIAIFIHQSSIVLLPFYWIMDRIRLKYLGYLICILFSYIFAEWMIPLIMPYVINGISIVSEQLSFVVSAYYYSDARNIEDLNLSNPIYALILNLSLLSIFYRTLIVNRSLPSYSHESSIIMINAFVLGIMLNFIFLRTIPPLARLSSYWGLAVSVLFSMYFQQIKSRKIAHVSLCCFVMYMFYRYSKHFGFYPELHFPYNSVLGTF